MSIMEQAAVEMDRANVGIGDQQAILGLMAEFFKHFDSGGAVAYTLPMLVRLISGQPLTPLTGADSEWHDPIGDGRALQNVRCGSVFKYPETGNVLDIDNPGWDGTFPYDPPLSMPAEPVMEVTAKVARKAAGL